MDAILTKRTDRWYGSLGMVINSYALSCNLCSKDSDYSNSGLGLGLEAGRTLGEKLRLGVKYHQTTVHDSDNYFEFDTRATGIYTDYLFHYFYIGLGLNHVSFDDTRGNTGVEDTTFSQFRLGALFALDDAVFADIGVQVGLTGTADFSENFTDSKGVDHGIPRFRNMTAISLMFGHYF